MSSNYNSPLKDRVLEMLILLFIYLFFIGGRRMVVALGGKGRRSLSSED